jgi:HEAT repeat protein
MKIRFKQDRANILKLLESPNIKKRLQVLDKLNGVNERETLKILIKLLEDESWIMRERAANKLVQYGNQVVPRLEILLKKGFWYTRAAACLALGGIASLNSFEAIVDLLLQDDNPTVIKEACNALVKLLHKDTSECAIRINDLNADPDKAERFLSTIEANNLDLFLMIKDLQRNE